MRVARLILLLGLFAGGLFAEQRRIDGRSFQVALPSTPPLALLLWLPQPGDDAGADLRWWLRSGLVDRGLVLACAQPLRRHWSELDDRPYLFRILLALREETGLDHRQVLIGAHGQATALAQDMALRFPSRFAGCVLARGASVVQVPPADAERPLPISILANWNDDRVPFARLEEIRRTLQRLGHPVRLLRDDRGHELGPRLWDVVAEDLAAAGVELAPVEKDTAPAPPESSPSADGEDSPPAEQEP